MNAPLETSWTKPAPDWDTWHSLLNTPDLDTPTIEWMIHRLSYDLGQDDLERSVLWSTLLHSDVPLTDTHLARLMLSDGPPGLASVRHLLAHPSAGTAAVAAILNDALTSYGSVREDRAGLPEGYAKWLHGRRTGAFEACQGDSRVWVRAMAASRRQGVKHWNPDWESEKGLLRGHGRAQRLWLAGMRSIDQLDDPTMWKALLSLTEQMKLGPDEVRALIASAA